MEVVMSDVVREFIERTLSCKHHLYREDNGMVWMCFSCQKKALAKLGAERKVHAKEIADLRLKLESEQLVLHMTVSRLGGTVEGHPTARLNFLQRIDELRRIEQELEDLKLLTYCAYCGESFRVDGDAHAVTEHIFSCPNHPIAELKQQHKQEVADLRKRISELEGLLRSREDMLDNAGIEIPGKSLW